MEEETGGTSYTFTTLLETVRKRQHEIANKPPPALLPARRPLPRLRVHDRDDDKPDDGNNNIYPGSPVLESAALEHGNTVLIEEPLSPLTDDDGNVPQSPPAHDSPTQPALSAAAASKSLDRSEERRVGKRVLLMV